MIKAQKLQNTEHTSILSSKGRELLEQYKLMATDGYDRTNGARVENAYNSFELKKASAHVGKIFRDLDIKSILDYGCGGSNWHAPGFHEDLSAFDFFNLDEAFHYEPARDIDERQIVDCVISFDVLEHIFISDVKPILTEMFSLARKLVVVNVACYEAAALLPTGENAHVTVRLPNWWKGAVDMVASDFPDISVCLLCSESYTNMSGFPVFSHSKWQSGPNFSTK